MENNYKAFLIRLNRATDQSHWRVSMENVHTGDHLRFATEQDALRYLWQHLKIECSDSVEEAWEMDRTNDVYPFHVTEDTSRI